VRRDGTATGWRRGAGPYRFAVAGLLLIALVAYGAFEHRLPLLGGRGFTFSATFQNASQLDAGSPVRIAGITVGSVTNLSRGPGDGARVTLSISPQGLPIHRDATLEIRPRLFLEGNFYVDLHPGSPGTALLRSGEPIPASQTSIAVQLDQVQSTFQIPVRQGLRTIIHELGTALSGGGAQGLYATSKQLAPVLDQTAQLTQALRGEAPHDLSSLITAAAQVTGTLAARDVQLAGLVTGADEVAGTLAARDASLSQSLAQLDALDQAAPAPLRALDRALAPLRSFSQSLEPSLKLAPPVLTGASALLDQLALLSRPQELPRLLSLLAPSLSRLPTLEHRLDQLFPLVTPVAQCVSEHVLPVLNSVVPDGSLSSGRPLWQELGDVGVALASYAQDFDGNGNYPRALGGQGDQTFSTGSLPGTGELFANASSPIEGARPVWLGPDVAPPYRPDQPCVDQPPVNLAATTGPSDLHSVAQSGASPAPALLRGAAQLRRQIARALPGTEVLP
jgi:phospholipid/cholesterol/gamma-HCH transport system substrate-binding protein